ncbi:MAG: peptidylprolyl isomerase [Clostridiales bacterium]|nr:peptidylprolyl isomerase [Candidatus Cacconaster stercorequi]
MSASKVKKNRQERIASGIADPKTLREKEEQLKERRTNRQYIAVAITFVVVALALVIWNSGIIQRGATAVTIDGEKYTAGTVDYYYTSSLNSIQQSGYQNYIGLDTKTSLKTQNLNDMAKMLLGVTEDMSWDTYLKQKAIDSLKEVAMTVKAANDAGFAFTDEMQAEADETLDSLATYAKQNGYSTSAYLKAIYGNNLTMSAFKELLHNSILASHFQQDYRDNLTYTDKEIANYYKDNTASFNVASYDYIYFKGTVDPTTDADGNTVEATDEENAAASAEAKKAANAAVKRVKAGEDMETVAKDYEIASYASENDSANSGDTLSTWAFDSARQAGDTAVLDDGSNYYVAVFHSSGRNEYSTVNVRHILFMVDSSALDSESETYEAELQKLKDEAKAKAEDALAKWKAGDATEDSFAALANELSEDGGSNTNGGLYEKIYKGQMVSNFNDWIFDESRQSGDTGIVYNEGSYTGYHVIYFVGNDLPYWKVQVTNAMQSNDFSSWSQSLVADVTADEGTGMKYVGR